MMDSTRAFQKACLSTPTSQPANQPTSQQQHQNIIDTCKRVGARARVCRHAHMQRRVLGVAASHSGKHTQATQVHSIPRGTMAPLSLHGTDAVQGGRRTHVQAHRQCSAVQAGRSAQRHTPKARHGKATYIFRGVNSSNCLYTPLSLLGPSTASPNSGASSASSGGLHGAQMKKEREGKGREGVGRYSERTSE